MADGSSVFDAPPRSICATPSSHSHARRPGFEDPGAPTNLEAWFTARRTTVVRASHRQQTVPRYVRLRCPGTETRGARPPANPAVTRCSARFDVTLQETPYLHSRSLDRVSAIAHELTERAVAATSFVATADLAPPTPTQQWHAGRFIGPLHLDDNRSQVPAGRRICDTAR